MGMAASQARFLGLTARKSNVEYEGQQVNQQRTAVSNQSASLYNQLLALSVPTPPDITNFYNSEYTVSYAGRTYTLTDMVQNDDGTYTANFSYTDVLDSPHTDSELTKRDIDKIEWNADKNSGNLWKDGNCYELQQVMNGTLLEYMQNIGTANDQTANSFYTYTDDKKMTHYIQAEELQNFDDGNLETVMQYAFSSSSYTKTVSFDGLTPADWTTDKNGNYTSIKLKGLTGNEEPLAVSAEKVCDEVAYNASMNEYNLEYAEYEKTMANINAKTEVIQQQDKTLELRLKQLDTERNALENEMEAVKSVIKKNVDNTFSIFKG
ncbi:MAG: hypothetical protein ACI4CY_07500 [Candidatus Gastranaerophilaceae bacterium]